MAAQGVKRGCGTRVQGGVYLEIPAGPHGRPVEYFLIDPPRRIDVAAMGVSNIGVHMFGSTGSETMHVIDVVGMQHYPNVADIVEEARRLGVSRRIARTANFSGLGPGSKLYLVHARGYINNHEDYYRATHLHRCPKGLELHQTVVGKAEALARATRGTVHPPECCAGLWWHDLTGLSNLMSDRRGLRTVGSVTYTGWMRPNGVEPVYSPAIIAVFPLVHIAVIRAADGSHEVTEHAARQSRLPVSLEDA